MGEHCFDEKGSCNAVSFSRLVQNESAITHDSREGNAFVVHAKNVNTAQFCQEDEPHVHDSPDNCLQHPVGMIRLNVG